MYLLHGEEAYFIDYIERQIEESVLQSHEKEFDQAILYGKDTDVRNLVSVLKRYPMISTQQVVIVREAQELKEIDKLEAYLQQPLSSTILVLAYKKKLDERLKIWKQFEKLACTFKSLKIHEHKVSDFARQYMENAGFSIHPRASQMVADYIGNDLARISSEMDKLMLNVDAKEQVAVEHVAKFVGISKEYNSFELQAALGAKNITKAFAIVQHFVENPKKNPLMPTLGLLYAYFSKLLIYHSLADKSPANIAKEAGLNPYFVNDYINAANNYPLGKLISIIEILSNYDLRLKGVNDAGQSDGELLKELVFKILN